MPTCIKCNTKKPKSEFHHIRKDGMLGRCKRCMYLATAAWKAANPNEVTKQAARWRKRHPQKSRSKQATHKLKNPTHVKAREVLNCAVRHGLIVRMPCIKCGNKKSEAHHGDYSKPLDVEWLCKKHHPNT